MRDYQPKTKFIERMKILLKDKKDLERFLNVAKTRPKKSIRANTLKIQPNELKQKLIEKAWKIKQLPDHPEIMQIQNQLEPGELGTTIEHLLGYYYVQEITSMMPIIALNPKKDEIVLDLCAAPGSKTSQTAALMQNTGTIIANDLSLPRISILSANLERLGVTNTLITRHPGTELIEKLNKIGMKFDKILIDAPCSGEGNIRCSPRTYLEWSEKLLKSLGKKQKKLVQEILTILKPGGELIYSTCTHAPEENEEVVQYLLENNPDLKIQPITNLPIKTRPGILKWGKNKFHKDMKHAVRIYHHDNDMEGFFLCKLKKIK